MPERHWPTRREDPLRWISLVVAWTVLDFRSGEIVWEQQIGTGSQFDSYVLVPMSGPGGALYVGVNGGFISMQDTR